MGGPDGRQRAAKARPAAQRSSLWRIAFPLAIGALLASLAVLAVVVASAVDRGERAPVSAAIMAPAATGESATFPPATVASDATPVAVVPFATDPELQSAIEAALGDDLDHFGVVVYRLRDGHGATINPDRVFYAASLFKLAVLYEAERRHAAGELGYDDTLQITEADAAEDLGTIGFLDLGPDGEITIAAALEAMVTLSDNATAVALLHHLTGAAIDTTLLEIGLHATSVNTQELPTTAADMAALMAVAYTGVSLDQPSRDHLRDLLLRQTWRAGIPSSLPPEVAVGNKTGTWPGDTHDVAFVEAPNGAYIIAILCDTDYNWDAIARVSRAVYDGLERR